MLDIDLLPEKPMAAYISPTPTPVLRVGDIVQILNDSATTKSLDGKPPWAYFAAVERWSLAFGLGITSLSTGHDDQIRLSSFDVKMSDINDIWEQSVGLALIQQNNNGGFQAAVGSAILSGLNVSGISTSDGKSMIFRAKQFEMVYNR